MESILVNLLVWIGLHSSYLIDQISLPEVVELTPERLTLEAYIDVPELLPASGIDERILGLYAYDDGDNETIYILQCSESEYESEFNDYASGETCEVENLMFQERLLHELVHHVQKVSGAEQHFTCRKFGEKEAYLLGGVFLTLHFSPTPYPIDTFWPTCTVDVESPTKPTLLYRRCNCHEYFHHLHTCSYCAQWTCAGINCQTNINYACHHIT